MRHLGEVKEPRNFVRNNVFARRGAREGWEDGTPPPHRDFKKRGVVPRAICHVRLAFVFITSKAKLIKIGHLYCCFRVGMRW